MEPENIRFGGGATETTMQPFWALYLLIAIVLILTFRREKAITPLLVAIFTIPFGQVVMLGALHFTGLRILILAGLVKRATDRGSSSGGKFPGGYNPVDRMVVFWTVSAMVISSLQWMDTQALIHNVGDFLDALGGYYVVRFLIPDGEAIRRTIKTLAVLCVIEGVPMIIEQLTHINVFGYFGGFPLASATREGSVRASGTMGALTAGPLGGLLIPLFCWLWTERKSRMTAFAGLAGAAAMAITSNSSTSLMALGGSLVGLAFWPLRKQMRLVRWGLVTMLVSLHLVMKAPVWALIARIDLTGSSSGGHRYMLVDNTIRHFSDWWLLGYRDYNAWGWDMWDTCNQFVDVALKGGLVTLVCYIAIISRSFGAIGNARKKVQGDREREWLLWYLGSVLFATVVAYFGINSGALLMVYLFVLLAFISVATFEATQAAEAKIEIPADQLPIIESFAMNRAN